DESVSETYNKHCRAQVAKLLQALGCDPNDPNLWRNAFIDLAYLHHNVGRLVHHRRSVRSNAASWTLRDERILLCGVTALVAQGDSERAAINYIADSKVFPHQERMAWQRPAGRARQHSGRRCGRNISASAGPPAARRTRWCARWGSPAAITKCGWNASTTRYFSVVTKASNERSAFESHRPAESYGSPLASR